MQPLESLETIQHLPDTGLVSVRSDRGVLICRMEVSDAFRALRHRLAIGMLSKGRLVYLKLSVPTRRFQTVMRDSRVPPMPRWHITRPRTSSGDLTWGAPRWDRVPCGQVGRRVTALFVPRFRASGRAA